jgi:putative transposase
MTIVTGRDRTSSAQAFEAIPNHAPRVTRLRSDNRPEFVSLAVLEWLADAGIGTALIDPGKPWQNSNDESFNGKLRVECLSVEWFRSRAEAEVVIETWRLHFNAVRPHSSLNYYLTPLEFKQQHHPVPNRAVFRE